MAGVQLEKLVKRYGTAEVVRGITLDIADGSLVVLVGPSGCGKSTTLRMIAGLDTVTAGTIRIGGRTVNDLSPVDRNIAMVFQNYALYPHMSVRMNMSFALHNMRMQEAEIERRVGAAAEMLGLTALLERKPAHLSGGQRQRVAMGRAIVRNPEAFLFDEPLSNLDAKLRAQMRIEIKRLHLETGSTMIFVTHDQVEAMTLADRIVVLRDGRIEQEGTPTELFERPANTFVAGFLGSPSMNLLPAQLHEDGANLFVAAGTELRVPLPRSGLGAHTPAVILGIRPDDIVPADAARGTGHATVAGRVQVVEPLGSESILLVEVGGVELLAKQPGRTQRRPGDVLTLAIDPGAVRLFDAQTTNALN